MLNQDLELAQMAPLVGNPNLKLEATWQVVLLGLRTMMDDQTLREDGYHAGK